MRSPALVISIFLTSLGALALVQGCAKSQAPQEISVSAQLAAQLSKGPQAFAVLKESGGGAQLVVRCDLDGHQELCLLDSGSQNSWLSTQEPAFDDYDSKLTESFGGISGRGLFHQKVIEVKKVSLLGKTIEDKKFARVDAREFPEHLSKNGILAVIGADILSSQIVNLDFTHRQIHLGNPIPESLPKSDFDSTLSNHLILPVDFNGAKTLALWDTGSFLTLVDENFLNDHLDQFTFLKDADYPIEDGLGNTFTLKLYRVEHLTIGSLTLDHVIVGARNLLPITAPAGLPAQAVIGFNVLHKANWYIDYPGKTWAVETK